MKIKLSKNQWKFIGKKAGWMKMAVINNDGYADGGEPYSDDEMDLMDNTFEYFINLDERGMFYADVRNNAGKTVFEIEINMDIDNENTIFKDGFMKNQNDLVGLKEYLVSLGIMKPDQRLIKGN